MKLIRLLAPLVVIVAGLAAPAPSAADGPKPPRPVTRETLASTCTLIAGTFVDVRTVSACEIGDGTIVCAEHCEYQVTALLDQEPPFQEQCQLRRGTFREIARGEWGCDLNDGGGFRVTCPLQLNPGSTWLEDWRQQNSVMVCGITVVPSEQPMS